MKLKIFRYDGKQDGHGDEKSQPRYDTFEFDPPPAMTVLSALFYVQERFDDSLSFRHSCRGAVCGTCSMLINKVPKLACRTQLQELIDGGGQIPLKPFKAIEGGESWDPANEILVEPLPHFPVLKDLIVDMDSFFDHYRSVNPVLSPGEESPDDGGKERLMDHAKVEELSSYTHCILCATCFGACPISEKAPEFIGPAALAKLYRFIIDPRDKDTNSRLELGNSKSGWWGCEFHTNCMRVCPRGVPPNLGIGAAQQQLIRMGKMPPI